MILGGLVLCSLLFVVYVLVRYFEAISPLKQAIPDLRASIEAKRVRLEEYEQSILDLRDMIPQDEVRMSQMERWIELLKQQYEGLQELEIEKDRVDFEKQIVAAKKDA